MNYTERDTYSMHTTNVFGNGPGPTLMGADTLIWLKVEGQTISARVESNEKYEPGQKVKVRFRINLASIFDEATTDRM